MEFKSLQEIQAFVKWAKSERLVKVKLGNFEFQVSELEYIEDANIGESVKPYDPSTLIDTLPQSTSQEEEEEFNRDLHWSSKF